MKGSGWLSGDKEGRVELSDGHSLYLRAAGPERGSSSTPAIVLVHGLGGTASEWLAVQRLVARFARVYLYERAGYHTSDTSTQPPTPANIAGDLQALLKAAKVDPPYLLVGHSFGGVLINQFLADYDGDVFGMVIVDSPLVVNRFPEVWPKLLGDAKHEEVIGLHSNISIDEDEYQTIMHESALNEATGGIAGKELGAMIPHNQHLKEWLHGRKLLGDRRLSVLFCDESNDFKKVYEYGVKHGHGTAEEQEVIQKHLETMSADDEAAQREHLALSDNSRFCKADGKRATHNVHLVDPEWVVGQIRWVFDGTEPDR